MKLKLSSALYHGYRKVRTALGSPLGFLALDTRTDDTIIASFPRSGSTWLRTMLTNILDVDARSDPETFERTIPGISIRRTLQLRAMPSPRLLKTHSAWRPSMPKAIYLVRDGRDAIASYYYFNIARRGRSESFREFFRLYMHGAYGPRWDESVESWLLEGRDELGDKLMVVRFEDMVRDTDGKLAEVLSFLDLWRSEDVVRQAIELSNLSNMRTIEQQRAQRPLPRDASVYRTGKAGNWQELLEPDLEREFMKDCAFSMHLAGYLQDTTRSQVARTD